MSQLADRAEELLKSRDKVNQAVKQYAQDTKRVINEILNPTKVVKQSKCKECINYKDCVLGWKDTDIESCRGYTKNHKTLNGEINIPQTVGIFSICWLGTILFIFALIVNYCR